MAARDRCARRRADARTQVASAEKLVLLLVGLQLCGGQAYRQQYARRYRQAAFHTPAGGFHSAPSLPPFLHGQYLKSGAHFVPIRGLHKRLALSSHTAFGNGKHDNIAPSLEVSPLQSGFHVKPLDAHAMSSQGGASPETLHVPASGLVGYDVGNTQEAYTSSLNQMQLPGSGDFHYGSGAPIFGNLGYQPGFGTDNEEKSVGRVTMQVYRGPTMKAGHSHFAPWGYYVWQPSGTETSHNAFDHI
ncbi:uncharacterized protein LOC126100912 [Schistocerca cancellata]|uniref:uncharacterized protein LOC126100912 n=1 Tax=Schistocerca cancellata TaxID=274614 RepID=UPI002118BD7C|nr:uncharacterized protein LOC126100912 [Schistocerca cancellata]